MASPIIHHLRSILQGTETLEESLYDIHLSRESRTELDLIADQFRALANTIGKKTQSFKPVRQDEVWEKSKDRRDKAENTLTNVFTQKKLPDLRVFRKNLSTIFNGPDTHETDSSTVTSKKAATRRRCERLRMLSVDGLISWAIAYPCGSWAGGVMGNDLFDCLVDDIEPGYYIDWPGEVDQILRELQTKKKIQSEAFDKLIEDLSDPSRHDNLPDDAVALNLDDQPPNKRNRETKYMFTDAPASLLEQCLPQPFRRAIKNSKQWKWERSQGFSTTSCLNTLFPRSESDDVSVTIWVAHNDGYRLNDMFGVTQSYSS